MTALVREHIRVRRDQLVRARMEAVDECVECFGVFDVKHRKRGGLCPECRQEAVRVKQREYTRRRDVRRRLQRKAAA